MTRLLPVLPFILALLVARAAGAQTDVLPTLWVTDEPVEGMAVLEDTLFLAGSFQYVGPPTGQLAALDKATGKADLAWPRFESVDLGTGGVTEIVPDGAGGHFVGGQFEWVSGERRIHLARVRADGTLDPDFRPDPRYVHPYYEGYTGSVSGLAYDSLAASPSGAGVLYVGGEFNQVGGEERATVAALDAGTGAVLPFAVALEPPHSSGLELAYIYALAVRDGVLYVSGFFDRAGGATRQGLAAVDGATGAVLAWDPALWNEYHLSTPYVYSFAFGDSTLYVGGSFDRAHGQVREGIAEVTLADPETGAGGTPTAWTSAAGFTFDMVIVGDWLWTAGFYLNRVNRQTGAVRRFLTGYDNAHSVAYDPTGASPSGAGVIYTGLRRRDNDYDRSLVVAAVDAGTGAQLGFEVLGGIGESDSANRHVRALAVTPGPNGRVLAAGSFLSLGGVATRSGLAALDLTTGRATPFRVDTPDLFGVDITLSPDGRYLYGHYSGYGFSLKEVDLHTGALREFFPPGRPGVPAPGGPVADGAPIPTFGPNPEAVPVERGGASGGGPAPYVANGPAAVLATDERVCISSLVCLDRRTTDVVWQQSGAMYLARDRGDLLYVPRGGPGGNAGTLYVAAPLQQIPYGVFRTGHVALDFGTGAVLDWTVGTDWREGSEGHAVARLDADGPGGAAATVYFGGDRTHTVEGQDVLNVFAVSERSAALVPWAARVGGGQFFPWDPVMSMIAVPRRAEDGGGGVVYAVGASGVPDVVGGAMAFDAVTGAVLPWNAYPTGATVFSYHVRTVLASPRHGAVFLAGGFLGSLRGSGHTGVVAVSPASPLVTVADEGGAEAPAASSLALSGPNPFRSRTALALTLAAAGPVEASLFDVLGRRVAVLHDGVLAAGLHTLAVDASALPAGVYVARVAGAGVAASVTLTVVR